MLACSETSYVLKLYVYNGACYDTSSRSGQGYAIVWLLEMTDIYDCRYHLPSSGATSDNFSSFSLISRAFFKTNTCLSECLTLMTSSSDPCETPAEVLLLGSKMIQPYVRSHPTPSGATSDIFIYSFFSNCSFMQTLNNS